MTLVCFCGTTVHCSLHCSRCGRDKDTPSTFSYCQRCTDSLLSAASDERGTS